MLLSTTIWLGVCFVIAPLKYFDLRHWYFRPIHKPTVIYVVEWMISMFFMGSAFIAGASFAITVRPPVFGIVTCVFLIPFTLGAGKLSERPARWLTTKLFRHERP
jgi:hypothetical protein